MRPSSCVTTAASVGRPSTHGVTSATDREPGVTSRVVTIEARVLARGPWPAERVTAVWQESRWEPPAELARSADAAVEELKDRGSPAHDGEAARLADWQVEGNSLRLE